MAKKVGRKPRASAERLTERVVCLFKKSELRQLKKASGGEPLGPWARARILELLTHKLQLFTSVLGEVDLILGAVHSERSFEELLREAWLSGAVNDDLDAALEVFGRKLEVARGEYDEIKKNEKTLDTLVLPSEDP